MDRLTPFRARFPEFDQVPDGMVNAALDDAVALTDATVWLPAHYEHAVRLEAAHQLALSPYGLTAKLSAKDGTTTYKQKRNEIAAGNCIGWRVTS